VEFSEETLRDLVRAPSESLGVELKQWIDPSSPEGQAKVVKTCLALRNNNGGCLIVGFKDDGTPDTNVPPNVRDSFHQDVIQGLVTKYSFHAFEVKVHFVEREDIEYPVICVGSGVETPVATKKQLFNENEECLIGNDAVFVRSLNSNNTASSTVARAKDWDHITKICFDNREADIGAFIRRHLRGIGPDELSSFFRPAASEVTPHESAKELLDSGKNRFFALCSERELTLPEIGFREASAVIDGGMPELSANEALLQQLMVAVPTHTGWPPWTDSRNFSDTASRPYVFEGAWEALLVALQDDAWIGTHVDYWRIDPSGRLYHLRGLEDDLLQPQGRGPEPLTQLDFLLQISRTTEVISVVLSFARAMGCEEQDTSVAFSFRWNALSNRHLASWADPQRMFFSRGRGPSRQDTITTSIVVPLETPQSGLSPYVQAAVGPLFELFGGTQFQPQVVDGIVNRTVERRL